MYIKLVAFLVLFFYIYSIKNKEKFIDKSKFCFIVLRHVNNKEVNIYWNHCIDCIRKLYPNTLIVIIDDHSKIKPYRIGNNGMDNIKVINSNLKPGRAEFLPYYYFYKKRFSNNAIIIHDTVFIKKKINDKFINTKNFNPLWTFSHRWNSTKDILGIIKKMDNSENLINFYNKKNEWTGFFGGMSIINLDYLTMVFNKNNYIDVLKCNINSREKRMAFERIIGLLLIYHNNKKINESVNKDIHKHLKWGTTFNEYINKKNKKNMEKVWVGQLGNR